ncbi:Family of unknown function [Chryseobacterium arachidis]|uniref:DUF695 domain-containing protein n=1 Tax=Chryseobacterium arachidis TaxID=1416778 RepID=A0A1M5I9A4_9FLAO|nr:DUF695 domain-containing protein [Chryseobacterium arachidis]SHG24699.1 Family of unknown function [Chryseobacterium arachidis]
MSEILKKLITDEDQWTLAEGENNGFPFMLRYRPHLYPFIEDKGFGHRLMLFFLYEIATEDRSASDEQLEFFETVENKIIEQLEPDLFAVLSFVYSGNGQREWHFYTCDIEKTEELISRVLDELDYPHTIEIQDEYDPDWSEYFAVLDGATEE